MKDEIDALISRILDDSLENMRQVKARKSNVSIFNTLGQKTAIFDEVIAEDLKIRDRKLELEEQNYIYRNNTAALAADEFALKL